MVFIQSERIRKPHTWLREHEHVCPALRWHVHTASELLIV